MFKDINFKAPWSKYPTVMFSYSHVRINRLLNDGFTRIINIFCQQNMFDSTTNQLMPREKLVSKGADQLSDTELLAIFLRTGIAGKTVKQLAAELLQHFGSVQAIIDSNYQQFIQINGLGIAKYAQLKASSELVKRAINEGLQKKSCFSDPETVHTFLMANFIHSEHERFAALFLNSKNQLLTFEYLFDGSINSAQVYPRTVAQHCLKHNAAAVIFAHNHPSGDIKPSQSDIQLTAKLQETLNLIEVRVLDHFVVGKSQTFSMASHQMI